MPSFRAVVLVEHQTAHIVDLDESRAHSAKVGQDFHYTPQKGLRQEHVFFADICDALMAANQLLVVGSHKAKSDFRRYVDRHSPLVAPRIVGCETFRNPTEAQLMAFARKYSTACSE